MTLASLRAGASRFHGHGEIHTVRARQLPTAGTLLTNHAGDFALDRNAIVELSREDRQESLRTSLLKGGLTVDSDDALGREARDYRIWERRSYSRSLDYLILVPTLRCNLNCSYCQVSRVNETRPGFDWSEDTLRSVLKLIEELPTRQVKIEFQGGEPTLRPDLIMRVMDACAGFERCEFVICTNLQVLNDEILAIFDRPDVCISTSLDGDFATHGRNRTGNDERTSRFMANLETLTACYGPGKISALPTIDPMNPPSAETLIDAFTSFGFESIFLRPINYQGFARKRHSASRETDQDWHTYYAAFIHRLIKRNWEDQSRLLEETYFSICLRRIFQPGRERHVDLRSPNPMGIDYVVIDHDGIVYPTDEARMLTRSGVIDLAIGHVSSGWAGETQDLLNQHCDNATDPTCRSCTYQAFCGRDVVDDLSRYGRIDLPRGETEFCRRHLHIFDLIFDLIYSNDPADLYSLSRWLHVPGTPSALGRVLQ